MTNFRKCRCVQACLLSTDLDTTELHNAEHIDTQSVFNFSNVSP